uniref:Uncharacterized protein n=1 Tax=Nelumbo nucifera TaxID=4432 RepID=A0A822XHM3_NELNU|nr:TPA_asm: hypothetical protein HUJ06_019778 [Nelumbo nucifera]
MLNKDLNVTNQQKKNSCKTGNVDNSKKKEKCKAIIVTSDMPVIMIEK